jgi:F0F1-type ATP synthase gamma subunit
VFLLDANLKEARNVGTYQQVSTYVIDGMGGVTNERHLEARVMGQQAGVEDVVPLVPNENVEEEQMEVDKNIGETFKGNVDQIEIDLERTILMIEDQENIVHVIPLSKQENANEDVEPHTHIDVGDIAIELHLT